MKIFSWMQNKLSGRQEVKKQTGPSQHHNQVSYNHKEEFNDWPNGLLAIGTFGNGNLKENSQKSDIQNFPEENFTPEEVGKLQKELTKLLSRKPKESECESGEEEFNLPLDQFLNCPSSLEVDRRICNTFCEENEEEEEEEDDDEKYVHDTTVSVVSGNGKDVCMGKSRSIRRKSISFLLKKMFVCRSGFGPTPSLADPIPESRMEKILRTLLHKKIYSQNPATTKSGKKYLGDRQSSKKQKEDGDRQSSKKKKEDEMEEKQIGCKWVKTDSEYIVLEI